MKKSRQVLLSGLKLFYEYLAFLCGAFCIYPYLSELPALNAFATVSPRTT